MNDSVVLQYPELSAEKILAGTKRAFREFYFRPRQIWRLIGMMADGGDLGMIWDIGKGFLSWAWGRKQDRVAGATSLPAEPKCLDGDTSLVEPKVEVPVIEAPRTDLAGGKRTHRGYEQVTANRPGEIG
ncbi:MAG: hypothetical protein GXY44_09270 [Phycisphaerales bacterium]|nr:hypothetical protein [Phycisphaerales bacterium]